MSRKLSVLGRVKSAAFNHGVLVEKVTPAWDIEKFLARFREHYVSVELVRIGGDGDGGYLLPNVFDTVTHCFSPGVSDTANFEGEISKKYGVKSFMIDASVTSAPFEDENFVFAKKFLGNRSYGDFITLSDWMEDSVGKENCELVLQMDIEGAEYDVLAFESADTLKRFSVLVIEFHGLQNIFHRHFLSWISGIFEKIYSNFSICHVHPNNCCGVVEVNGIKAPRVLEITFLRNDLVSKFNSTAPVSLPHKLDRKNVEENDDILMPKVWWSHEYEAIY